MSGSVTFKVFMNENGQAVYAGDVTAPSYEDAKAFVISEGFDEKDFMLIQKES